jgi:CheY-like chemotaxis protein
MRILIVDDCSVNTGILRAMLREYGETETARDGVECVEAFKKALETKRPFNLVCLDISMPEMDGIEALHRIREAERNFDVGEKEKADVLIITAFSDQDSNLKSVDKCQGLIPKPVTKAALVGKLSMLGHNPSRGTGAEPEQSHLEMIPIIVMENGGIAVMSRTHTDKGPGELGKCDHDSMDFFNNAVSGQQIARLSSPDINLSAGDGVMFNPQNGVFSAAKSGKVIIKDNVMSIQDTITLKNGARHKHVHFVGFVEIEGDVADGVTINAVKGLDIKGNAGACHIKSGGDIEITRIDGKGKGHIRCGGNLMTGFLYDTEVDCRGNVVILKEAVDGKVRAGGHIRAGILTGGEYNARDYIEVNRAGSPKDVSTLLKTGMDCHRGDKLAFLEAKAADLKKQLDHIRIMLGPAADNTGDEALEKMSKRARELALEKRALDSELADITYAIGKLGSAPEINPHSKIVVNELICKGVRLQVGDASELVGDSIRGPVTIDRDLIRV